MHVIKVAESEFKPLLDRDEVATWIRQNLGPWTKLIHDLTSYGSNLIPRCYSSSGKSLRDAVVLAVLLRQVVAMLDGVDILLESGAVHAAHLQLRALFEASVYIEWILAGNPDKKAMYYYVHDLRRQQLSARRMQAGSPESQKFVSMMNKWGVDVGKFREVANEMVVEIDRILSQPELAAINQDFEKHRKGRYEPAWHVPCGETNLRTMARSLGREALYVFIYSGASEIMHSSSYGHHVRFSQGELNFRPIRSPETFATVCRFSVNIALSTFRRILEEYRPEELPALRRKYLDKWQKEFLNFPEIKVQFQTTRI